MNKGKLITELSKRDSSLSYTKAMLVVNEVLDIMTEALVKKEDIRLAGFGNFSVKYHNERKAYNPQTHEELTVPAKFKVSFKASSKLNDAMN